MTRRVPTVAIVLLVAVACSSGGANSDAACPQHVATLTAAALDDGLVPDGDVHPLLPDAQLSLTDAEFDALTVAIDATIASAPESIEARYLDYLALRDIDPKEAAYGLRLTAHDLLASVDCP